MYLFLGKDSNEKTKNIYIWIQQFYFGRKQKYLWKCFYTIKKPLNNRARVIVAVVEDNPCEMAMIHVDTAASVKYSISPLIVSPKVSALLSSYYAPSHPS